MCNCILRACKYCIGEKKNYTSGIIHHTRFKLPSKILLPVILFEGGIASDASVAAKSSFSMSATFSFANVFHPALEVGLYLDVVASLGGFGGRKISAQSEPDDEEPSAFSSTGVASAGLVVERTTLDCRPFSFKTIRRGLWSIAILLLRLLMLKKMCTIR